MAAATCNVWYFAELPEGVQCAILQAGGISAFQALSASCSAINKIVTSEIACEQLASVLYPAEGLSQGRPHYRSWRELLADWNGWGGMWCLETEAICNWKHNSNSQFFQNRMQMVALCRRTNTVHALLDAYGESDLRDAGRTNLVLSSSWPSIVKPLSADFRVRGPGHHLCVLTFPLEAFESTALTTSVCFVYNGGGVHGTDYECAPVLEIGGHTAQCSARALFTGGLGQDANPLPPGAKQRHFVPTHLPYDVHKNGAASWDLPKRVRDRFQAGGWGRDQ